MRLPPLDKRAGDTPSQEDEIAMGSAVILQTPDSTVKGIETRVTGKAMQADGTLLYRLEACAEGTPLMGSAARLLVVEDLKPQAGVIRATAAQLMTVLGKACPFVGPGLWTVTRGEVSPKDWGQLCRLVKER